MLRSIRGTAPRLPVSPPPCAAAPRPDAPGDGERPAREARQAVRIAAKELVEAQALKLGLEHATALVEDILGNERQQGFVAVLRIAGAASGAAARCAVAEAPQR